jgi:hypothetical protein
MFNDDEEERANMLYDSYKNDFPEKLKVKTRFDVTYENVANQYEEQLKRGY